MKEYYIINTITHETTIIFGYSWEDAVSRSNINKEEWELDMVVFDRDEIYGCFNYI